MNKQNYKEVSTIGRWGRMHLIPATSKRKATNAMISH